MHGCGHVDEMTHKHYCVVPENIHTPPTEGFLVWTPDFSGTSSLSSYFPLKILVF